MTIILDYLGQEASVKDLTTGTGNYDSVVGAMTFSLLIALHQKASPILVTRSLVKNVLDHRALFLEFASDSVALLTKKYGPSITFSHSGSTALFKHHCSYTQRMHSEVTETIKDFTLQGKQDKDALLDLLAGHPRFLEDKAPPSLRYYTTPHKFNETLHKEMSTYALCAYAPLSPQDYIIKKVSKDLLLLIPRSYTTNITSSSSESTDYQKSIKKLTPLEKRLGLKVNHLADIATFDEIINTGNSSLLKKKPLQISTKTFVRSLSKLFITKAERAPAEGARWALYIAGHGCPTHKERTHQKQLYCLKKYYKKDPRNERAKIYKQEHKDVSTRVRHLHPGYENIICSLPLKEFRKFLHFLEKITTSMLFYTSCFAGGEHLITPYQIHEQDSVFSYDIVVGTVSENSSLQDAPSLFLPPYRALPQENIIQGITYESLDIDNSTLAVHTNLYFNRFFSEIKKTKAPDYHTLTSLLHPYTDDQYNLKKESLHNCAHLRKACATSFSPVLTKPPFCVLKKDSLVHKDAHVFLLADHVLSPFSLKKQRYQPSLLSILPGLAWHLIPAFKAPEYTFLEIVFSFFDLPDLSSGKLFWIKKLEVRSSEDLPKNQPPVLYDVIITRNIPTYESLLHASAHLVYFTDSSGVTRCLSFNAHSPIKAHTVPRSVIHQELYALFAQLKQNTENSTLA
ncbi:hypothetical protein H0X06_03355 [Candidatus Dependentiae bacterium]|nr:hypothetical protein [Candidatus Dependentiae bacterium]